MVIAFILFQICTGDVDQKINYNQANYIHISFQPNISKKDTEKNEYNRATAIIIFLATGTNTTKICSIWIGTTSKIRQQKQLTISNNTN